jgi:hypothetical protein
MPLQKLETLVRTSDELKGLAARTRRLQELQTIYFRSAPRRLAEASRVRDFRGGTLFVSAVNAAVAAKLRQLAPTLLASIRETEAEVTALRIDVQVAGAGYERQPRSRKIAPGPRALEQIEALSERVSEGNLKGALTRLVRRQRRATRTGS